MAYAQLKTDIAAVIRNNGNQEITGNVLQGALLEMINALGANYQYAGVADTSTTITTTEANVFYLLTEAGTYSNMSSSIVHTSGIGIALWNGTAWSYQNVPSSAIVATDATPTENSTNPVQSGAVYAEINDINKDLTGTFTKELTWSNGYITTGGVVTSSSLSKYTQPFLLKKGEKVTIGTNNNSICIIGTTTADSLTTGNTITPIEVTPASAQFYTVTYTATQDIKIVLCVRWSDYSLTFFNTNNINDKIASIDDVPIFGSEDLVESGGVYDAISDISNIVEGRKYNYLRGYYVADAGAYAASENYFSSDYIPVKTGDTIVWTVSNEAAGRNLYLCYYDSSKAKVGSYEYIYQTAYTKTLVVTTQNVAYLRATFLTGKEEYASIKINGALVWIPQSGLEDKFSSALKVTDYVGSRVTPVRNYLTNYLYNGSGVLTVDYNRFVCEDYIPISFGDKLEWIYADGIADSSCYIIYYYADKTKRSQTNGTDASGARTIMWQWDSGYIRAAFRKDAFNKVGIKINDIWVYKPFYNTGSLNAVPVLQDNAGISDCRFALRNGSQGNAGNANVVLLYGDELSSGLVIPVEYGHTYKVWTSRPNTEGYSYYYAWYGYNTITPPTLYDANAIIHKDDTQDTPISEPIVINDPTIKAISITLAEKTTPSGTPSPLRITSFDLYNGNLRLLEYSTTNEEGEPLVVARNNDKLPMLVNSCRFRKTNTAPYKDWQGVICTDSHGDMQAVNNAIDASEGIDYIDCVLHLGDYASSYYTSAMVANYQAQVARCTKPWYFCVGNHDVGNAYYVGLCCDHTQAYNAFIAPLITAGFIPDTNGKCYWYKDLTDYKLRIICLYEYDDPMDFDETYWKAITYDSTLANIAPSTTYSVGQKVNAGAFGSYGQAYTAYSFECVQGCTTSTTPYNSASVLPKYKIRRGDRVIRQTQAQWFLDTLASTPANYGVVILTHNPYGQTIKAQDVRFNYIAGTLGSAASQDDMSTNFIQDALAAFKDGSNYSANVAMKGDAAYMNTQGGNTYAYSVSKNFASKNSGVYVACALGGHVHLDKVYKDETAIIYAVNPICATRDIANATGSDIRRTDTDGLCYDSLTVVSTTKNRIGLTKLGVNVTENGVKRDYEVIDTSV